MALKKLQLCVFGKQQENTQIPLRLNDVLRATKGFESETLGRKAGREGSGSGHLVLVTHMWYYVGQAIEPLCESVSSLVNGNVMPVLLSQPLCGALLGTWGIFQNLLLPPLACSSLASDLIPYKSNLELLTL